MDGNHQTGNGLLSHILDPRLGQVFDNLVRSVLPQQEQQPAESVQSTSPEVTQAVSMPPLESAAPARPDTIDVDPALVSQDVNALAGSSSNPSPTAPERSVTPPGSESMPPSSLPVSGPASGEGDVRDVEMTLSAEGPHASASTESSRSDPAPRNSRRTRVEIEEDEDDWRESNRQRMHSPVPHDDQRHHFMPIPDDHAVPQANHRSDVPPTPSPDPRTSHPPEASNAARMVWTFAQAQPENAQATPGPRQEQDGHPTNNGDRPNHGQLPTLNFFINIPVAGHVPTQPGAANPNGNAAPVYLLHPYFYPISTDGGNGPAQPGFTFPRFTFPFGPFGMDMMEERDDPERAQRLVDGLEEVPVGLVKRMERVGGPGTVQGETPTCAICWESLLEPEGGGFEGNAELAKAEAAQAAREDEASQRESSMEVDSPASTASGDSSSSPRASPFTATSSTSSGEKEHPKIVVLPCSHVFHASCLLPWFSKPGRTTCPSCRFDIDPDSLTYRPRPLRTRRPEPPAAVPQAAAVPEPQSQQQSLYGPHPPPSFAPVPPQPAPAPATAQVAPNVPSTAPAPQTDTQAAQGRDAEGQPRQQHRPLPPFITFDISMVIPVFPGRPAGAAQPPSGGQAPGATAQAHPQGAQLPPPRTDQNGFRLDDPVLTEAVRTTFERIFGRPAPPPRAQPPPQPQEPTVGGTVPGDNAPREVPLDWFTFAGPLPGFPPVPPPSARNTAPERPAPKRKWTLPPPPGPTLRQMVERNEREMGLRCSDVSCGLGPSDDEPTSTFDTIALRQISIRPLKSNPLGRESVCEHKFHPSCLVTAERVAGWGGEDKKEDQEDAGEDIEVSCPVCRAVGVISRLDWEEGACSLA